MDYLVRVLAWFEERDQRLTDLWHARPTAADAGRRTLEDALASPGRSREALEKLAAALACAAASPDSRAQESWLMEQSAAVQGALLLLDQVKHEDALPPPPGGPDRRWRDSVLMPAYRVLDRQRYTALADRLKKGAMPLNEAFEEIS